MTGTMLNHDVLELNRNWLPVRIVKIPEAFTQVARGVAEFIDVHEKVFTPYDLTSWTELSELRLEYEQNQHDWIRTSHSKMLLPRIIRLLTYTKRGKERIRFSRKNIYRRDRYTCQYCGNKFQSEDLNLDHVVPRKQGGVSTWENLVCSCYTCNTRKGGRTPRQAGMKLIRLPKKPMWTPAMVVPAIKHESWKTFVDQAYWNVELED